ncbi:MAG TPA: hypothetical protein VHY34_00370, partial [Caulobacteraceae bacterium]|nr:hypothetical protein [Caulobacteraceae bacterium]
ASLASITIHFFSTSAGFSEAVVFVCMGSDPSGVVKDSRSPSRRGRGDTGARRCCQCKNE